MTTLLALPLRNLGKNRRRHLATGIALATGFVAALLIGAYANSYLNYLRVYTIYASQTGHLAIFHEGGLENAALRPKAFSLTTREQSEIAAILGAEPGVARFGPELSSPGLIGNGCKSIPFLARSTDPGILRWTSEHPEIKRWAPRLSAMTRGKGIWNYPQDLGAVTLGSRLAELAGKPRTHDEIAGASAPRAIDCRSPSSGDEIASDANVQLLAGTWSGSVGAVDGEIVGQFSTGFESADRVALSMSLSHLQKLLDTDQVERVSVWLRDEADLARVTAALRARFDAAGLRLEIYPWTDERVSPLYAGTASLLRALIVFAGSVLASLVVLSVLSTVTITVLERSREIGALRALGYRAPTVVGLFVAEYGILVLSSLLAGGAAGLAIIASINRLRLPFTPPGAGSGMTLFLVPDLGYALCIAASFVAIASMTVWLAVRRKAKERIPVLLARVSR